MAIVISLDIDYGNGFNMGTNYPTLGQILQTFTPKLSLNFYNPVLNGINKDHAANQNGLIHDENSSSSSIMEVDANPNDEKDHTLETLATLITQYIQTTSTSLKPEIYQVLPYFCQFIGNETGKDVSQTCLKALCFLSVCICPSSSIEPALDMIWKVSQSVSWKAKMSILEFLQTFVFTNFMSVCLHDKYVKQVEAMIVTLMSDETLQVRQKATKILCGLCHSKFINEEGQKRLLGDFRSKIRRKMTKRSSGGNKFKKEKAKSLATLDKAELAAYHSGVLGLSALVEAYPYDVPEFVPEILVELEKHLHDPLPIPKTIKDCFQEFKRTHQDNWSEHRQKFTEDQLLIMTDLLVSPNYYA